MDTIQTDNTGGIGAVPRCQACGSAQVVRAAFACFNPEYGLWEVETLGETVRCNQCQQPVELVWSRPESPPHQRIRELNDRFRTQGQGRGSIMLTLGVQEQGGSFATAALHAVRSFDDFSDENDPWGEHDFGAVEIAGKKVFFKLDYYDLSLEHGSENPANEGCTHRVLTIMLASEY